MSPPDRDSPLSIRLRGVVKRYGPITAVDGLDLDVPEGTCVGLLASRRLLLGTGEDRLPCARSGSPCPSD